MPVSSNAHKISSSISELDGVPANKSSDESEIGTTASSASLKRIDETLIVRALDISDIYVAKGVKNDVPKTKRPKKSDRVYNSRHECYICEKICSHINQHMQRHEECADILKSPKEERFAQIIQFRIKGDDVHNRRVLEKKSGELFLSRRQKKVLFIAKNAAHGTSIDRTERPPKKTRVFIVGLPGA